MASRASSRRERTTFQRLTARARRYIVPLVLLDVAVIYLFTKHVALREAAAGMLSKAQGLSPRDPGSLLLEQGAQQFLTSSILALGLASCGALAALTLLAAIAWSARCLRKSRRFAVALLGQIDASSEAGAVRILDISSGGCRVLLPRPLASGSPARVRVGSIELPPGRFVWSAGEAAGLQFSAPLEAEMLAQLTGAGCSVPEARRSAMVMRAR